jgi:hypothetical protein
VPHPQPQGVGTLFWITLATALHCVWALLSLVKIEKLGNLKLLMYSMAYACYLLPGIEDYTNVLATDWKCPSNSKPNLTWRKEAWGVGTEGSVETEKLDEGDFVDDQKMPPKEIKDPFMSVVGGG